MSETSPLAPAFPGGSQRYREAHAVLVWFSVLRIGLLTGSCPGLFSELHLAVHRILLPGSTTLVAQMLAELLVFLIVPCLVLEMQPVVLVILLLVFALYNTKPVEAEAVE